MKKGLLPFLLLASLASIGWSPRTELAVARRGALLGPPDLARQVRKHSTAFTEGVELPRRTEGSAAFRAELAERRILELSEEIVRKLDERSPFEDIVRDLGSLSHWIVVAGDPLASCRDSRLPTYAADYAKYADALYDRLPRVYYGIDQAAFRGDGLSSIVRDARGRGSRLAPFIGEEYYRSGRLRSSSDFDDLAVTFGVASIALSHSASDIASLFTAVWRRANGDVRPLQLASSAPGWRLAPSLISTEVKEHKR
jgi:hypothetical protein